MKFKLSSFMLISFVLFANEHKKKYPDNLSYKRCEMLRESFIISLEKHKKPSYDVQKLFPQCIQVDEKHARDSEKFFIYESLLHHASCNNDVESIDVLLNGGVDIEKKTDEGTTALHVAALHHKVKALDCLCKNGANVKAVDENKLTALHYAVRLFDGQDNLDCVQILIDHGADVNTHDRWGYSPLKHLLLNLSSSSSCRKNYEKKKAVKLLDLAGANISNLNNDEKSQLYSIRGAYTLLDNGREYLIRYAKAEQEQDATNINELVLLILDAWQKGFIKGNKLSWQEIATLNVILFKENNK